MRIRNHTGVAKRLSGGRIPYGGWLEVDAAERVVHDAYRLGILDLQLSPHDKLRRDIFHWKSPFSLADGYATAAENMTMALRDLGVPLYLEPVWFDIRTGLNEWTLRKLKEPFPGFMEVGVCMATPGEFKFLPTRFRIGFTMYESDDPLAKYPEWRHDCDRADLLVVPNEYAKGVFGAFFRRQIETVPLALNPIYCAPRLREAKDTFTFVTFGTLSGRKSPLETIQCFQRAFPTERDVRLVLKTRMGVCGYGANHLPRLDDDRITIIDVPKREPDWSPERVRDWLWSADCMVFLSKGEGYGLPPREAAATGLPLIYAHNSGMSDIRYGYPVRTHHEEDSPIGGKWRIPDWDVAVDTMRHVYEHREDAYEKAYHEALDLDRYEGPLKLKGILEDVSGYKTRPPLETPWETRGHGEYYDAVAQMAQGPVVDIGVGPVYVELARRGYDVSGVTEDPQRIDHLRKAGIEPRVKVGPLTDLPPAQMYVSQGVFQDLHIEELRRIADAALRRGPLFFSVPSVHYPRAYSEQSRLGWRREWDDLFQGYERRFKYYDKKRHLMGLLSGVGKRVAPSGHRTREGVWRAYEGVPDD